jgi:hypothetical protein
VGINISRVFNSYKFSHNASNHSIIGPHSLNTLQARAIGMKIYCDDITGGAHWYGWCLVHHPLQNPSSLYYLHTYTPPCTPSFLPKRIRLKPMIAIILLWIWLWSHVSVKQTRSYFVLKPSAWWSPKHAMQFFKKNTHVYLFRPNYVRLVYFGNNETIRNGPARTATFSYLCNAKPKDIKSGIVPKRVRFKNEEKKSPRVSVLTPGWRKITHRE